MWGEKGPATRPSDARYCVTTSAWSDAEFILCVADLSESGEPIRKPAAIPSKKKCTKGLCGWLRSIRRHVKSTREVVAVLASGRTRGESGCP